jgi:hypothetical protein
VVPSSYPVATQRALTRVSVDLDCSGWRKKAGGFVYDDPTANGQIADMKGLFREGLQNAPISDLHLRPSAGTVRAPRYARRDRVPSE